MTTPIPIPRPTPKPTTTMVHYHYRLIVVSINELKIQSKKVVELTSMHGAFPRTQNISPIYAKFSSAPHGSVLAP